MEELVFIDSGNTHLRMAKHVAGNWEVKTYRQQQRDLFTKDLPAHGHAIISSVNNSHQIKEWLSKSKIQPIYIEKYKRDNAFLNWEHEYSKTIGDDRIIQIYYIAQKNLTQNIAIIDAGTFLTCDFINKGEYQGGTIHPGVELFLESYSRGQKLPVLNIEKFQTYIKSSTDLFPKNTEAAIYQATYEYLRSILFKIQKLNVDHLYITGGNTEFIALMIKYLDLNINVSLNKNLIFEAMEYFFLNLNQREPLQ